MTIEDQIKKIELIKGQLEKQLPEIIKNLVATDLVAMISHRVINEGKDYKGNSFGDYSTSPMLSSKEEMTVNSYNKIAGTKSKRINLEWVEINGKNFFQINGGYRQFRKLHGHTNNIKNFSFTNEMWRKFGLKRIESRGLNTLAILGGTNESSQKKIDANSKREGISIIEPSKQEREFVENSIFNWIEKKIKGVV